ncbi:hypothetical protein NDU88_001200 [Pleurodeles waltl]|uniref:Uncharacterized protein n=1 Tax=Pleurodeles waltl TaxID=8319 RepID=A0AAV7NJE2_PLEWA|nr:hypothetical protein NDU88_001200 [Pleurodeles waltl]
MKTDETWYRRTATTLISVYTKEHLCIIRHAIIHAVSFGFGATMSSDLNSEGPEDESFFCAGAQGDNTLVQRMKSRESIDSKRTSISKASSRHSCSTAQEHRESKTRDSSSSRSDSKSSFSENSEDSGHEDLAESYRSPRTSEQSPLTKNVTQQKKKNASCAYPSKGKNSVRMRQTTQFTSRLCDFIV